MILIKYVNIIFMKVLSMIFLIFILAMTTVNAQLVLPNDEDARQLTITEKVIIDQTDIPIVNAELWINNFGIKTDKYGEFELGISSSSVTIRADVNGHNL